MIGVCRQDMMSPSIVLRTVYLQRCNPNHFLVSSHDTSLDDISSSWSMIFSFLADQKKNLISLSSSPSLNFQSLWNLLHISYRGVKSDTTK